MVGVGSVWNSPKVRLNCVPKDFFSCYAFYIGFSEAIFVGCLLYSCELSLVRFWLNLFLKCGLSIIAFRKSLAINLLWFARFFFFFLKFRKVQFLSSRFSFTDTDASQDSREGRGPPIFLSITFTRSRTFRHLHICM